MTEEVVHGVICRFGEPRLREHSRLEYRQAATELRALISMRIVEGQIANGGLAQLLWNTCYHWEELINDCRDGYAMIGAMAQHKRLEKNRSMLGEHAPACRSQVANASETSSSGFDEWYRAAESAMNLPEQSLYCESKTLKGLRQRWMERNAELISKLCKQEPKS